MSVVPQYYREYQDTLMAS